MPQLRPSLTLALLSAALAGGCGNIVRPAGTSPLKTASMSPDSVVLEFFFVRVPFADAAANGKLWDEINEQSFDVDVRRRWQESGLRIGRVDGECPRQLQELLQLVEAPPAEEAEGAKVDLLADSPVSKSTKQVRAAVRCEIVTSGIHESLPLVSLEDGELRGRSYPKGQGVFGVKSYPQGDGRVKLDLQPELHYGEHRQTWVGSQGILRLEAGRAKKVFDPLALSATLAPGEMLVLTGLPERKGTLGHYFFSEETGGKVEQKLLVIRLAQTQYDELFSPEIVLPPEE